MLDLRVDRQPQPAQCVQRGGGGIDIDQVSMTITAARGCAHRNEHRVGPVHSGLKIKRKGQTPRLDVLEHQGLKTGFINRNLALVQPFNFGWVFVDTNDLVPKIRKTYPRHKPNIACPNHCNLHKICPHTRRFGGSRLHVSRNVASFLTMQNGKSRGRVGLSHDMIPSRIILGAAYSH